MQISFQTPHEKFCFKTATSFSVARGRGAKRTRKLFLSFDQAIAHGKTFQDGKSMIYAINEMGNNAHICNV